MNSLVYLLHSNQVTTDETHPPPSEKNPKQFWHVFRQYGRFSWDWRKGVSSINKSIVIVRHMKYWEILLTNQRKRGRDGLTIPFLIGSQQYLPGTQERQGIKELILDMTSKSSFETCLCFCMGTQTFIFEIKKSNNATYFPTKNQNNQNGLSVAQFDKSKFGDTVEQLIKTLEDMFQGTIEDENFSAEPNVDDRTVKWNSFSEDEDIPFIQKSFNEKCQLQLTAHLQ